MLFGPALTGILEGAGVTLASHTPIAREQFSPAHLGRVGSPQVAGSQQACTGLELGQNQG